MTQREREILKASVSWTDKTLTVNEEKAFQAGAKWADEHPKSEMLKRNSMTRNEEIQKLIDEEMGIDNYGSCDFQVGVCYGVRYADKTMIDNVCEWLEDVDYEMQYQYSEDGYTFFNKDKFIKDFRKAMEE